MSTDHLANKPSQNTSEKRSETANQPFSYEKYLNMSKYLRRIGINDSCRTQQCRHENGCLFNTINQTVKGFSLGYTAKSTVNIIGLIMNMKRLLRKPSLFFKAIVNKESLRFGLFPAVYNLVLHSLLCIMKRKQVNPALQSFVSGFVAGFIALATRQYQNRSIWGIFLLARAFDCCYQSLCNRGVIQKRSMDYQLIFSAMYILVGYCYACEPQNLPSGFNKFLRKFTLEDEADLAFRRIWIEKTNLILQSNGCPINDPEKSLLLNFRRK